MGVLIYDQLEVEIDDRTLAHLQEIIIDKLRADEGLALTLEIDGAAVIVWIGPSSAVEFVFHENRVSTLNQEWIEVLALAAASAGGLWVVPEPDLDAELREFLSGRP